MVAYAHKIVNEALSLPNDVRAEVVSKLLESLNLPAQKEIDRLWGQEAEKRLKELKTGKVKAVPGARVFAGINQRYFRK
ncbi:MAG: hypothetical protein A2350_12475 [Candidatus Raymondbacteria bacterium RifOxyB12_full_50_8]|nr:MAG: hypothetical protein A2350_12475 [Candidatus Raymondbacteria bacterium RifOxyB12_full_50_8]